MRTKPIKTAPGVPGTPTAIHDCDITEQQINVFKRERDDARAHAEALAEALRDVLNYEREVRIPTGKALSVSKFTRDYDHLVAALKKADAALAAYEESKHE